MLTCNGFALVFGRCKEKMFSFVYVFCVYVSTGLHMQSVEEACTEKAIARNVQRRLWVWVSSLAFQAGGKKV